MTHPFGHINKHVASHEVYDNKTPLQNFNFIESIWENRY